MGRPAWVQESAREETRKEWNRQEVPISNTGSILAGGIALVLIILALPSLFSAIANSNNSSPQPARQERYR